MDVILASSRGKGLEELIRPKHPSPNHLFIKSTSSANLHLLTIQAINIISKAKNPSNHHIYIIGEYCDLNEIIQHKIAIQRNARYQEFVFREEPEAAVSRLTDRLVTTSQTIANHNAKPILCTIPPSSLHTWNYTRLLQRKTAMLEHFKQYPSMQQNMIKSLLTINTNIIGINKKHGSYTPKLADTIIKKPGGRKKHRVHFSRLVDGVHPSQSVKEEWANMILKAIEINRSSITTAHIKSIPAPPSSDSDSDPEHEHQKKKRKWLY